MGIYTSSRRAQTLIVERTKEGLARAQGKRLVRPPGIKGSKKRSRGAT